MSKDKEKESERGERERKKRKKEKKNIVKGNWSVSRKKLKKRRMWHRIF